MRNKNFKAISKNMVLLVTMLTAIVVIGGVSYVALTRTGATTTIPCSVQDIVDEPDLAVERPEVRADVDLGHSCDHAVELRSAVDVRCSESARRPVDS